MRQKVIIILFMFLAIQASSWGLTGHRTIGKIAEVYLSKKAKKEIKKILGTETLAEVANWMDFIKSEPKYDHMKPWHYVTIPDGQTYETAEKAPEGDVIWAINKFIDELKSETLSPNEQRFALKSLVHLIGDVHQPLHVGNGTDKGGNDVKLKYFWKSSNLHRVWDSGIIDGQQLSYTEWVSKINHASDSQVEKWQAASINDWAMESMAMRSSVYEIGEEKSINYRYNYDHIDEVELRLLQAGIRLAGVLNEIYK
ncbi:MAG: S1/P1 Nuclease [Bacteroidetes bacterium]|nr:MAG: S1/P1 Nuclease [Bacteroidota bacterium]